MYIHLSIYVSIQHQYDCDGQGHLSSRSNLKYKTGLLVSLQHIAY